MQLHHANDNYTTSYMEWKAAFVIGVTSFDLGLSEEDYPSDMNPQEIEAFLNGFNDRRVSSALRHYVA